MPPDGTHPDHPGPRREAEAIDASLARAVESAARLTV